MAASDGVSGMSVKTVSIRPKNADRRNPTIVASVVWMNAASGEIEAIIDGTALTKLRTGATTGVATDVLAPHGDCAITMIGAGGQARAQVEAVAAVRPVSRVTVVSRSMRSARALADDFGELGYAVRVSTLDDTDDAVGDATVICCATPAERPILNSRWLPAAVHVNAIGAYLPSMCELDHTTLARASVVAVEQCDAALDEAGDIIQAIDKEQLQRSSLVELGSLIATPPQSRSGVTVFKSVGLAIEDWAIARLAVERARGAEPPVGVS